MLNSILVPLDGSELSEKILLSVSRILTGDDTEVVLLHLLPEEIEASPRQALQAGEAAEEYMDSVRERLERDDVRVRCDIRVGDPAEGILQASAEIDPTLITMSTHGRGGVDRWMRGSVAERVLRNAQHPLLLCSPAVRLEDQGAFRRILVPLDGSRFSAEVLPLVRFVAWANQAQVTLYRAVGLSPTVDPATLTLAAEKHLAPIRNSLESAGIPTRVRVDLGPPAAGIFEAIEAEKADLVAMATHGRSGISRWTFGSVAGKVLHHCPVPFLAARPHKRTAG